MAGDIFIAVCTLGNVRAEWAVGLASMHQSTGRIQQLSLIKGHNVPDARNLAVNLAISLDAEYLLFWDDDMIPRRTDASRLLITALDQLPEVDVIGAVYPMRRNIPEPCVVEKNEQGIFWGWQDGKIHPVYMVGTGFMAMRLARLKETVPQPYQLGAYTLGRYFQTELDGMGGSTTDDFWFAGYCEHWGLRQYVHGGVICDQIQQDGEMVRVDDAVAVLA